MARGCCIACCCKAARNVLGHCDETINCSPHDGTDIPPSGFGDRGSIGGTLLKEFSEMITSKQYSYLLILLHYLHNTLSLVYVLDAVEETD